MFNLRKYTDILRSDTLRAVKSHVILIACILFPITAFASADRVVEEPENDNFSAYTKAPLINITPDEEVTEAIESPEIVEEPISASDELAQQILDYASKHVGRPYRYGSGGPKAFDCSGFTSYIFKNFGVNLTRSSRSQYNEGEKVNREDIKPGDLLFFKGRGGNSVGHVGIAVDADENGKVKFIHAATSKGVTYSTLDEAYYAKRYIGAKRVLND